VIKDITLINVETKITDKPMAITSQTTTDQSTTTDQPTTTVQSTTTVQ